MNLIGTKWKPLILFHLLKGPLRSGLLQQEIEGISNKMFTQTVRELEKDGLISRASFPRCPTKSRICAYPKRTILRVYFKKFRPMGLR